MGNDKRPQPCFPLYGLISISVRLSQYPAYRLFRVDHDPQDPPVVQVARQWKCIVSVLLSCMSAMSMHDVSRLSKRLEDV